MSTDPFEACKARRRALTEQAMKIGDVNERGHELAAMPVCRRFPDGKIEVVEPPPPPPVDDTPFVPHLQLAARTGVSGTIVTARDDLEPEGAGPFVEIEAGYRWRRSLSLAAFAEFTHFADDNVPVSNGIMFNASIITVTDNVYTLGARVNRHFRAAFLGGGLGLQIEDTTGYQGVTAAHLLQLVEGHIGYRVASTGRVAADVMVMLGEAGHGFDGSRELFSAQCMLGLAM